MKPFRSPLFWVLFALAAGGAALFAKTQFARAFPLLDQPLTMGRQAATEAAERLAHEQEWSPGASARTATRLRQDSELTTFIELESGGKENLGTLLREGKITPYRWQVRLFREKDAAETLVLFRPDGRFLGFREKLPEAQPGPELTEPAARSLAEAKATALGVDLGAYHLAESKNNRTSSGRLDQSFTYEREEPLLGAGRDQIMLTVRGDRLCGIEPHVKLPEDFARRYTAMRASNTNLQLAANVAFFLLLGLGGCVGGLIYLARKGAIDWRGAFLPAGTLALGAIASALNLLPLSWFDYDTALSPGEFQTKTLVTGVIGGLALVVFIPILAAAEGLGRAAFPGHPSLWKVFSRRAAGSREVFGAVAASYGLSVLMFGYAVFMARFGVEHLGWWSPSSALFDPSQLGATFPWVSPVFISFMAGLTEECMFRALPLAGAVLLGRRFGRSWLWIGAFAVLQAIVFGAAHSNYPTMPGWARMVELLLPSFMFAALYLRFGLLPGIMTHFLYDVIWLGLPVAADQAPGARLNFFILAGFALAPLVWVLICGLRAGAWIDLPAELRNAGWTRPLMTSAAPPPLPAPAANAASPATLRLVFAAGLLALIAWGVSLSRSVPDMPGLAQRKDEAIAQARAALVVEGVPLGADWEVIPLAHSDSGNERTFVWQTSGAAAFRKLSGNALALPGWRVRFLRSTLPLPDRAEEYRVFLTGAGQVQRYEHVLPETRTGAQLQKAEAQAIAERELKRIYQMEAADLVLVTANETKQPARSDWRFVWKDPKVDLNQGESRLWIKLAGDALCGYERHVFIPEEWTRAQASGDSARNLTTGLLNFTTVIALIAALIAAARARKAFPFAWRTALAVAGIILVVFCAQGFVKYPSLLAWWATDESFKVQTIRFAVGGAVGAIFSASFLGALAGLGTGQRANPARTNAEFLAGLGAGLILLLGERLVLHVTPQISPWHCGINGATTGIPFLSDLWMVMALVPMALCWIRVQTALPARLGTGLGRTAAVATLGLCYGASFNANQWLPIVLSGLVCAVGFVLIDRLVLRTHPSVLVAVAMARFLGKAGVELFQRGHPDAVRDALIAAALISVLGLVLYRLLRRQPAAHPEAEPPTLPRTAALPTAQQPASVS
ncbi:MAG: CPBP family intramembrane metalloprotease [Opitutaceae bacterium]|nr:CPBP family intramembrane metalloprotease [Opitutaceae bacterium]